MTCSSIHNNYFGSSGRNRGDGGSRSCIVLQMNHQCLTKTLRSSSYHQKILPDRPKDRRTVANQKTQLQKLSAQRRRTGFGVSLFGDACHCVPAPLKLCEIERSRDVLAERWLACASRLGWRWCTSCTSCTGCTLLAAYLAESVVCISLKTSSLSHLISRFILLHLASSCFILFHLSSSGRISLYLGMAIHQVE